jgi:membrane protein implicated in regulation of membrane protease activity
MDDKSLGNELLILSSLILFIGFSILAFELSSPLFKSKIVQYIFSIISSGVIYYLLLTFYDYKTNKEKFK